MWLCSAGVTHAMAGDTLGIGQKAVMMQYTKRVDCMLHAAE